MCYNTVGKNSIDFSSVLFYSHFDEKYAVFLEKNIFRYGEQNEKIGFD